MMFVRDIMYRRQEQVCLIVFLHLASTACTEHSGEALYWQDPPYSGLLNWEDASDYCESLNDGESEGWRLPNIDDLRTLVRGCSATGYGGPCPINDIDRLPSSSLSCLGCEHRFGIDGIYCYWDDWMKGPCGNGYWSSSIRSDNGEDAFFIDFAKAAVLHGSMSEARYVRCVEAKR